MADWYQGYTPDTTDKDAARLLEIKYGYLPLTMTRYPKSALLVGPVGKRQYVAGDKITHNGKLFTIAEVEKTLSGYTILATGQDGEPEVLDV